MRTESQLPQLAVVDNQKLLTTQTRNNAVSGILTKLSHVTLLVVQYE